MHWGWQELLVILVIVVIIFGGTKLAGLGKASGRAIREFKDELKPDEDKAPTTTPGVTYSEPPANMTPAPPAVTPAPSAPAAPVASPPASAADAAQPGK